MPAPLAFVIQMQTQETGSQGAHTHLHGCADRHTRLVMLSTPGLSCNATHTLCLPSNW